MKEGENKHVIRFRLNFREMFNLYDKGGTFAILELDFFMNLQKKPS